MNPWISFEHLVMNSLIIHSLILKTQHNLALVEKEHLFQSE